MEELKCEICGCDYSDDFYKTEEHKCICEECFLEYAEVETSTRKSYFLNGDYIGNDEDMQEVIDSLCSYTRAERID